MKIFEYKVQALVGLSREHRQICLNDLGAFGWELVALVEDLAYLKREIV